MSREVTFKLSNGVNIPGIGFGTFSNEGAKGETYKAVVHALRTGYRHLDCAWFYLNEGEVGDGVRDFLKENQNVKRSDLFITTKVWNHLHEPEEVKWSLENSLKNFGLDYVDLFLIHWPIAAEKDEKYLPKIGADGKVCTRSTPHPASPRSGLGRVWEGDSPRHLHYPRRSIESRQSYMAGSKKQAMRIRK